MEGVAPAPHVPERVTHAPYTNRAGAARTAIRAGICGTPNQAGAEYGR